MELAQFITASLAPAVAMSTAALVATNLQGRYSEVVDRIRALNDERRNLSQRPDLSDQERLRFASCEHQITLFLRRARHIRDAVVALYGAILFFLATSFAIAFISENHAWAFRHVPRSLFLVGLGAVALGVLLELLEMRLAFRIVKVEVGHFSAG